MIYIMAEPNEPLQTLQRSENRIKKGKCVAIIAWLESVWAYFTFLRLDNKYASCRNMS